jgi:hypothetical protein
MTTVDRDDRVGRSAKLVRCQHFDRCLISAGALIVSVLAYRRAGKMGLLNVQFEAITHIRNARRDMMRDGNITAKTVASIHDTFHISSLVFGSRVTSALRQAHVIAYRLHRKSFDRLSNEEYRYKDFLLDQLDEILKAMLEEAALSKSRGSIIGALVLMLTSSRLSLARLIETADTILLTLF